MRFYSSLKSIFVKSVSTALISLSTISASYAAPEVPYTWDNVAMGGGGFVTGLVASRTQAGLLYARTDVGGAYRWEHTTNRWEPLLDWVSADELGYLGVESMAIDEATPNNLYIQVGTTYFSGGRSAILKSTDYGHTFSVIDVSAQFKAFGNGMGRQTGEKLQVDKNSHNVLYAGTRWNGIWKSTDYAETWTKLTGFPINTTPSENGVSFVVLDSRTAGGPTQTIYAGVSQTGSNLYVSHNAGSSFTAISGGPTTLMPARAELSQDGYLYITYASGAGPHAHWALPEPFDSGQVWKYNTNNGAWTNITPAGYNGPFGGVSIDPNNSQRIVLSTMNTWMEQAAGSWGDRYLITTNGGTSWTDVIARSGFQLNNGGSTWVNGQAIHWSGSITFNPFSTNQVWVTSGHGVFKTDNIDGIPSVWDFTVRGLEESVPLGLVSIPNGPVISVIYDFDGFRHTDVRQYAPIHEPRIGSTTGLALATQNHNFLVRVGESMYYTTNMGQTWTKTATINGIKGDVGVSADGAVILHTPEGSTTTYRTTNNGNSWTTVPSLGFAKARPFADAVNPNVMYVYNPAGSILKSTDKGATFSSIATVSSGAGSNVLAVTPGFEGHVWAAVGWGGLLRTTNGGTTWTQVSGPWYAEAVGLGKAAPGVSYPTLFIWGTIDGIRGLYRSIDQGANWVRVNDDAHEFGGPANGQFVVGDMNIYGRVYMSTAGRGVVFGEIASTTSSAATVSATSSSVVSSSRSSLLSSTPVSSSASSRSSSIASVASSSRSSSSSSISSSVAASGITCQVLSSSYWGSGYQVDVRVTNNGAAVTNWGVKLSFSKNPQVTNGWNAVLTQSGMVATARNAAWNGNLASGGSTDFGFQGSWNGNFTAPTCAGL